MKHLFLILILLLSSACCGQSRCMQLCFNIFKNKKSIKDSTIRKSELKNLSFEITYFNCGKSDVYVDTMPSIGRDYSDRLIFDDLGISSIIIRLFKNNKKSDSFDNYERFFLTTQKNCLIKKEPKILKLIPPGANYTITKGLSTDYFKLLPPGEYEVSLDYVDEVFRPDNAATTGQNVDTKILTKYQDNHGNLPRGYFMQFSKNTVRFTVIE